MLVYHKPTTVSVKRQQDPELWTGTVFGQVFHGVFDKDENGKGIPGTEKPGEFISYCVRDEKGFEHFAGPDQITLGAQVA